MLRSSFRASKKGRPLTHEEAAALRAYERARRTRTVAVVLRDEAQVLAWKTAARKAGHATAGEWARAIVDAELAGRAKAADELARWKQRALATQGEIEFTQRKLAMIEDFNGGRSREGST